MQLPSVRLTETRKILAVVTLILLCYVSNYFYDAWRERQANLVAFKVQIVGGYMERHLYEPLTTYAAKHGVYPNTLVAVDPDNLLAHYVSWFPNGSVNFCVAGQPLAGASDILVRFETALPNGLTIDLMGNGDSVLGPKHMPEAATSSLP